MTPIAESTDRISRERFLLIINAAVESQSYRFARQIAQAWLTEFPGDLEVGLLLGISLLGEGNRKDAITSLEKISRKDPEFCEIHRALYLASEGSTEQLFEASCCSYILGNPINPVLKTPEWSIQLQQAYSLFINGSLEEAEKLIHEILGQKPELALAAVLHLRITQANQGEQTVNQLANLYHSRWPECLQFKLILAQTMMEKGDETKAVDLLHECAAEDSFGLVPNRLWGKNFRYAPIWPDHFEIPFDFAIPAAVAGILGWNMLAAGELLAENSSSDLRSENESEDAKGEAGSSSAEQTRKTEAPDFPRPQRKLIEDETIKSVEEAFASIAKKLNRPAIAKSDGRFPVYVIMSIKSRLTNKYGSQTSGLIESEMQKLAETVSIQPRWGSLVFFPDDAANATEIGLKPLDGIDPWKIKLALVDLDTNLARKGEMIGALLIVGNGEVVPFHMLPNPTDDVDIEVASDNPYSTLDSNYFIPEWPVGRLPGEIGTDAGLLLDQLRRTILYHSPDESSKNILVNIVGILKETNLLEKILSFFFGSRTPQNFGYSAAVWKESSHAVYKLLGESKEMLASPPEYSGSFATDRITCSKLNYFNLHGLEDGPDWYGQREITSQDQPDYPVAVSPKDIAKNGHAPNMIFTEACYGANIINKSESDALSLKFLSIGTPAIVGSTCVSYGSISAPLIGADLLGYLFWKRINSGYGAGEALMQAKVDLAKEMDRRQGFLDGEDQKTLISFVLYGDPLVGLNNTQNLTKNILRLQTHATVKTINDFEFEESEPHSLSHDVIQEVKKMVETYLPGLDEAKVGIKKQILMGGWEGGSKEGQKKATKGPDGRTVVTISKHIQQSQVIHRHYARATLDQQGKIVKLAFSK